MKSRVLVFFLVVVFTLVTITAALADDGFLVRKSMSHVAKPSVRGYVDEAEHAFIHMMEFYVPIQAAEGIVEPIEYVNADEEVVEEREFARPLIGAYLNGPVEGVDGVGFTGHGRRDAFASVSLDDGNTWKVTNLSESANKSSSSVVRGDIDLFKKTSYAYPGDVVNIFHAVDGNKVLVAWPSRYCSHGQPGYSLDTDDPSEDQIARRDAIAAYMGIDLEDPSPDDLYLMDMYGVAGHQGSVDYADDKHEQNWPVGVVPYNCLWTARGVLVDDDDPRTEVIEESYMRWFSAERMTSGVRDVNRIETRCVADAGCAITWQEDPEGLRPGDGEGPGEGWSGATANHQTDVWYSYIPWDTFDVVQNPDEEAEVAYLTFEEYTTAAAALDAEITQKPKPFVPFAIPMRMTDNAKCNVENPQPYCNGSAIPEPEEDLEDPEELPIPMEYGLKDLCANIVTIGTSEDDTETEVCVTEDGLPLVGNVASTRPRLHLHSYDYTVDEEPEKSAFVVVVSEESKGLGEFGFTDEGTPCDPELEPEICTAFDEGKNIWYYSFSMSLDDTLTGDPADGLPANLTSHGNILNQPQVDWEAGDFYPVRSTELMWDFEGFNFDLYNTEIARRGSMLAQDIPEASNSVSGLIALPSWKQGVMKQGGPADVMLRRIIIPDNWEIAMGNPYAFRNMACENWGEVDENGAPVNPFYPEGICLDSAINLSATIPDSCIESDGALLDCPVVDLEQGTPFGVTETNPILQGSELEEPNTTKVLSWHQCPASFSTVSGETEDCSSDARTDDSTLADQSWYNPLDVAKGHRGYLDGDFVMILYAWSPNWRLNAKGSDRYELYVRRSFDGAQTWTTLPANFMASDGEVHSGVGTVTCETHRRADSDAAEPRVCNSYGAGADEQARNVTQLKSMKFTTLDPRYAFTADSITADPFETGYAFTDEDTRDPSRYFIVYETGDNTTTSEGEPEPLDLFYSRAVMFGDHYQVWAEDDLSVCYPSDPHFDEDVPVELIGSGFCHEFDQFEQGKPGLEASESSLTANSGGEFLYGVWTQLDHDTHESDAMARRVWWIDDYIPTTDAWDLGGGTNDNVVRSDPGVALWPN